MNSASLLSNRSTSLRYVLIADDDLDDQELIKEALLENNLNEDKMQWVNDGVELMSTLRATAILPSLIILDLNMPRKDGKTALLEIKADQSLKHIPIIIFSTSDSSDDILDCYNFGSNTYITKPTKYKELVDTMADVISYWGNRARIAD